MGKTIFLIIAGIIVLVLGRLYFAQNIDSKQMTTKQKILRTIYPIVTLFSEKKNLKDNTNPVTSFYDLSATTNDGGDFNFPKLKGKKVLIVNTASDCGFTAQYGQLQKLYEQQKDKLIIIAFPANDFKEQERGDDAAIASFCQKNYGVTFPLMKKSVVIKSEEQNEVFRWLTDKKLNGWNEQAPEWNFSKYLVNEEGALTNYFSPGVSPLGKEIKEAVNK